MVETVYTPAYVANTSEVPPYKPAAPDLGSYLAIYARRITASTGAVTGGGASPLYTVPVGKQFYLIAANISAYSAFAIGPGTILWPMLRHGQGVIADILMSCLIGYGGSGEASLSFTPPLRFLAGQGFALEIFQFGGAGANCQLVGTIIGYEIDTSLLNSIL